MLSVEGRFNDFSRTGVISLLSSSAHFFLMKKKERKKSQTVVSPIPKCRANEKEDLPLFNIWITSLFCPVAIYVFNKRKEISGRYSGIRSLRDVQLMYRLNRIKWTRRDRLT